MMKKARVPSKRGVWSTKSRLFFAVINAIVFITLANVWHCSDGNCSSKRLLWKQSSRNSSRRTQTVAANKTESIINDTLATVTEEPSIGNRTEAVPPQPRFHAVTYASHSGSDDRFCRAIESAARHKIELTILGWGTKWLGLHQKLDAALSLCESLPPGDIILFVDGFDVMFSNTSETIMYEFLAMEAETLFGAECGCWPHIMIDKGRPCFELYPPSPTPYRYLNSGTWIATAGSAAAILSAIKFAAGATFNESYTNDQELVADMYINGSRGIRIDHYSRIFQSMHLTGPEIAVCEPFRDISTTPDGRFRNSRTDTFPAIFHFNGGGKDYHLDMDRRAWFRSPKHNTPASLAALRNFTFLTPTILPAGRLSFGDICEAYWEEMARANAPVVTSTPTSTAAEQRSENTSSVASTTTAAAQQSENSSIVTLLVSSSPAEP